MSRMASIFARSVARSVARSGRTARGRRPTTRALPQPRRRTARQQLLVAAYEAQASADAYRREVLERDTAVPSDTLLAGAPAERAVVVFCAGALFTISHVMARHWLFCLLTLLFLAVVISGSRLGRPLLGDVAVQRFQPIQRLAQKIRRRLPQVPRG